MSRTTEENSFNIDNVKINRILTPIIYLLALVFKWLSHGRNISIHDFLSDTDALLICLIPTGIYFFSSRFFQPDLDQTPNRPGKYSFPISTEAIQILANLFNWTLGVRKGTTNRAVHFLIRPISFTWYVLWEPYALMLTHRGVSHWPIIGTLTRFGYLFGIIYLIDSHFGLGIDLPYNKIFFINMSDKEFIYLYLLPVYLSDIIHSSVDFMESTIKGYDFCAPRNERGYISRILRLVGLKITI